MSREIKFRAWNGEQMVSPDYITRDGIGYWREDSIPCYSEDLMQFTGLKDKNGIDIYEEDKLLFENGEHHSILFLYGTFGWFGDGGYISLLDTNLTIAEVIGNIHENKNQHYDTNTKNIN